MAVEKNAPNHWAPLWRYWCTYTYIYIYLFIFIYVSKMVIYCMAKHIQLMLNWWLGARWFGIRIGVPLRIPIPFTTGSQKSKLPTQTNNLPVVDSWCFQHIWQICSSNWIISPGRWKIENHPDPHVDPEKEPFLKGKFMEPNHPFSENMSVFRGVYIYIYI